MRNLKRSANFNQVNRIREMNEAGETAEAISKALYIQLSTVEGFIKFVNPKPAPPKVEPEETIVDEPKPRPKTKAKKRPIEKLEARGEGL